MTWGRALLLLLVFALGLGIGIVIAVSDEDRFLAEHYPNVYRLSQIAGGGHPVQIMKARAALSNLYAAEYARDHELDHTQQAFCASEAIEVVIDIGKVKSGELPDLLGCIEWVRIKLNGVEYEDRVLEKDNES